MSPLTENDVHKLHIMFIICVLYISYIINRSEGVPQRDISSLGTLEDGAGQVWGVLPPAPYKGRKFQDISNWMGPHMGNKISLK